MRHCRGRSLSRQRGFALVAAIFLMVVLAGIGALAVRAAVSQRATMDIQLLGLRARAAAEGGVQYAAARLLAVDKCQQITKQLVTPDGFDIVFSNCIENKYVVNGVNGVSIFTLDITASKGTYGSPDFVSRTVRIRVAE